MADILMKTPISSDCWLPKKQRWPRACTIQADRVETAPVEQ